MVVITSCSLSNGIICPSLGLEHLLANEIKEELFLMNLLINVSSLRTLAGGIAWKLATKLAEDTATVFMVRVSPIWLLTDLTLLQTVFSDYHII